MEGVGHFLMLEKPAEFNAALAPDPLNRSLPAPARKAPAALAATRQPNL